MTKIRSESVRISSNSTETTKMAVPASRAFMFLSNQFDGADVHASRRLTDQQDFRTMLHLARDDELFADYRRTYWPSGISGRFGRTSRRESAPGERFHFLGIGGKTRAQTRLAVVAQDGGLLHGEIFSKPCPKRSSGTWPTPLRRSCAGSG